VYEQNLVNFHVELEQIVRWRLMYGFQFVCLIYFLYFKILNLKKKLHTTKLQKKKKKKKTKLQKKKKSVELKQ
jgi:cell division protein FtsB